jgi:hypothetical protein
MLFYIIKDVCMNEKFPFKESSFYEYLPVSWKYSLSRMYWIHERKCQNHIETECISCKFIMKEQRNSKL